MDRPRVSPVMTISRRGPSPEADLQRSRRALGAASGAVRTGLYWAGSEAGGQGCAGPREASAPAAIPQELRDAPPRLPAQRTEIARCPHMGWDMRLFQAIVAYSPL